MDIEDHVPSLTHLREFTRARAGNRATHVAQDKRQVTAPAGNRVFAFAYERFLTGVVRFVGAGNRGGALEAVVSEASARMRPSYEASAKGMVALLDNLKPLAVARRQRNVVVVDDLDYEVVSLRVHLLFDVPGGPLAALMYFSEKRLTDLELAVMDTAVALAVRQIDPGATPAIVMVRQGAIRRIDPTIALSRERVAFLKSESRAYRAAWAAEG